MSDEVGRVALEIETDTSGLEKAVDAAAKKASDSLTKSFEQSGEKIQQILSDTERSMKSKASSIAAIYKKQGMSSSEAMTKAWGQIERGCGSATGMAQEHLSMFGKSAQNTAERASRAFSGINTTIKKIGVTLAAVFSAKMAIDFGKQCIELGSDLAEVQNVVDVTFPNMSAQIDKFAQSAAQTFGLSETMAKKFTGTFGSMAEAFGFSEKEAYEMSTALTGLAGDVASFYNISQDEAYTKLKSVFSGETETLKDLGIVMTQSALDAYAMANGYGKATSAMTEMEKVSLRYAFVQSQLTNATGDFWRTQDSWANQSRILALQAQSAMAAIGQGLINLLKPALVAINTVMARVVQLANTFKNLTETLFGSSGSAAATASNLSSADKSAASLSDNLSSAVGELTGLSGSTGSAAKGLGKASKAAQALQRSLEGFDQITKVSEPESGSSGGGSSGGGGSGGAGGDTGAGIDTGAITGISDSTTKAEQSVSKLSKAMQTLLAPAVKAWNNLKNSFGRFADVVKSAGAWILENVLKPIGKWTISKAVPAVLNLLAAGFDVLTSVCEALAPTAQWIYEKFLVPIGEWTGGIIVGVLETLTGALKGLSDWIDKHQTAFSNIVLTIGAFAAAWTAVSAVVGVAIGIFSTFSGALSVLATAFSMASSAGALIQGVLVSISPATLPVTAGFASVVASAVPITAIFAAVVAAGVLLWKNWDTVCQWAGKLRDTVASAFQAMRETISGVWSSVTETVAGAWETIKNVIQVALMLIVEIISAYVQIITLPWRFIWENCHEVLEEKWDAIRKAVSTSLNAVEKSVSTGLKAVKSVFSTTWKAIQSVASNAVEKIKKAIVTGFDTMKSKLSSILSATKSAVSTVWTGINTTVTNAVNSIKTKVTTVFNAVKSAIITPLKAAKSTVSSILDSIKSAFNTKLNAAKNTVTSVISKIKSAFKFSWSLPKLKLPHFSVSGKFGLNPPSVPSFGIKWYKKAMNNPVLLDKPTLFGAGEAGPEVVAGAEKLKSMIAGAVQSAIASSQIAVDLSDYAQRNTPRLAAVSSSEPTEERALRQMVSAAQSTQDLSGVETLLREILTYLKSIDPVRFDDEAMRKYFIRKTNDNTRSTGQCELLT